MRKFLYTIITGLALAGAGLVLTNCTDDIQEEITELQLGRCMTPTKLSATVTSAGDVVRFDWSKSKGATGFILEIYSDEAMTQLFRTVEVAPEELPVDIKLEADMSFHYRVMGHDANGKYKDSNWAVYEGSAIKTYAIKSSLSPEVTAREAGSISLAWTLPEGDTEITHILVSPKPAGWASDEFAINVADNATVSGLEPSTCYTLTVCYKSADRGSVTAWTRPSSEGFTTVSDTASFKQALADGASRIKVAYSDEPYVMGEMKATGDFSVVGESTVDGSKPVVAGRFTQGVGLTSIHIEDLSLTGEATADGQMSVQTHVITIGEACTLSKVEITNCDIYGYQRGIYYDNYGANVSEGISLNGIQSSYILGSGGDNFDLRKACSISSITVKNSTFNHGCRTVFRIDAPVSVTGALTIENCTFNAMCQDNGNTLGGSNVQGILAVKATCGSFNVKNNLFLNMNCWLVGGNTACIVPAFSGNYAYNCCDAFFTSAKADGSGARTDMSEALVLTAGAKLISDPCKDSAGEVFNVEESAVIKANAGDPRWFAAFVDKPEDLTQTVTVPVKTWNFADTKTFYKQADKDMVRDGIRFYVKTRTVIFDSKGIQFTGEAATLAGVPADGGIGILVDRPGAIVASCASAGTDDAHITVSAAGRVKGALAVGEENRKIVIADIPEGKETMIYLYPCGPVSLTMLQWTDDISDGASTLGTPATTIDKTSVNCGASDEVTVSWDAIDKAGSYGVIFNDKTNSTAETSFKIATASLKAGSYEVGVYAVPAGNDFVRQPSDTSWVSFEVVEVLSPLTTETVWGSSYFTKMIERFGAGTEVTKAFVADNLGYVPGSSKFKFAVDNPDTTPMPRVQTGGSGEAGTKSCMQIMAGGKGTLTVTFRSSGAAGRFIKIAKGTEILSSDVEAPAKDADPLTKSWEIDAASGDIINIFGSGAINFYEIKWTPAGGSEAATTTHTWDFSSAEWVEQITGRFTNVNTNESSVDFTFDGLRVNCGGGSMKYNYAGELCYIQAGGAGSATKRTFEFDAPAAGTLKVWSCNTGDSEDLTRLVCVKAGDADPVSVPAGYKAADGPKEFSFEIPASGKVIIYPGGNGLRFYKFEFTYAR